jgi:magnesium-transporting ATPase (P-type)
MEPSAPPLNDLDDETTQALLSSPRFIKKLIDTDERFQKLYEREWERKREERINEKEMKRQRERLREQEIARRQEESRIQSRLEARLQREREMSLLGIILKNVWLICIFTNFVVFIFRMFSSESNFITDYGTFPTYSTICLPFVVLSVLVMIFFTDA